LDEVVMTATSWSMHHRMQTSAGETPYLCASAARLASSGPGSADDDDDAAPRLTTAASEPYALVAMPCGRETEEVSSSVSFDGRWG
jgi:hypothetical protein